MKNYWKPQGKKLLTISLRNYKHNIKTNLIKVGCEDVNGFELT